MKLENFNEAFERMGQTEESKRILTEADNRKAALADRLEKLGKIKDIAVKALQSMDVERDFGKFNNYMKVLDWVLRLCKLFKESSNGDDNKFMHALKYADFYINQIAKSIESGQPVTESLMEESLNYISEAYSPDYHKGQSEDEALEELKKDVAMIKRTHGNEVPAWQIQDLVQEYYGVLGKDTPKIVNSLF